MKIFSNFDTEYKNDVVTKFVMEHGRNDVLVIQRSSLFLWVRVLIPFFFYTICFGLLLYVSSSLGDYGVLVYVLYVTLILIYISLFSPIFKRLIDYYCDFTIVTPTGVFLYNQR